MLLDGSTAILVSVPAAIAGFRYGPSDISKTSAITTRLSDILKIFFDIFFLLTSRSSLAVLFIDGHRFKIEIITIVKKIIGKNVCKELL